ncbi:hypothetical protein OJAV_G00125540 [Oryzias javanicus]|uniref:Uncharacterized protein n=1 Tax=Oryzias javanicus TaxID=123683 RepID=A0A3S2PYA5_ORYJA|nr:hypothetical protein OJAV_G00125540 [Oryzias javanicus]
MENFFRGCLSLAHSAFQWFFSVRSVKKKHRGDLSTSLMRGLRSLNSLSEMLLSTNADIILPGCQTFDDIRQEIEEMKQHLEESEQIAVRELQHLDQETESLTAEQSHLENQKKRREGELENLKLQLDSYRSSLKTYNEALRTEKNNLQSAERTLRDMRRKRDEAEKMRNVGIGLMFIPIIGLIPGAVLTAVGQIDLDSASEQDSSLKLRMRFKWPTGRFLKHGSNCRPCL